MKALKWIVAGVGGVTALGGAIVGLVFMLTAGVTDAADRFFAMVGRSQYEEAYRSTSPQFQAETGLAAFRATMQRFRLDTYRSSSWNSRAISGSRATLAGTIATRGGGNVAVRVSLVEIGEEWKVEGLHLRGAGLATQQTGAIVPAPPARRPRGT